MSGAFTPRAGSTAWLLRHEIVLGWRGIGARRGRVFIGVLAVMSAALHFGAWELMKALPAGALPPAVTYALGAAAWFVVLLMLSQSIALSVSTLFERGDLDLLLSSPLPTQTVFTARGLGIAVNTSVLYLFLLAPVANVGLFTGHASLLAIYPTLLGIALAVSSIGLAVTLLLVRVLGARRARTVAQVLSTLVGAGLFLCSQAYNALGPQKMHGVTEHIAQWMEPGGPLAVDSPVWWPARGLMGDARAMLAIAAFGVLAFGLVVRLAHRRFLAGTQESVAGSARRGAPALRAGSVRLRAGAWRNVLVKEWRLIVRDPQLITQTLMQVLYMMPMMFILMRHSGRGVAMIVTAVVYLACSLASNIAWITVAAEEAPELLGTAPVPPVRLRWLKLLAALLPVWLLVAPMAVWLAWNQPLEALVFLACMLGGTTSVGAGQILYPRQGKRGDMKKRAQGHGVLSLLELATVAAWAALAYCLAAAPWWTPLPLLGAALGSGAIWLLGRTRRDDLAAGLPLPNAKAPKAPKAPKAA